jgi:SAM-dependent methyltransferase
MLIDEFFEVIAREYDLLIDRQRNLENIANLITFLKQFCVIEQDTLVLDYGSGTGLSMLVEQTRGIRIVGVERSQAMREIAASRGMNVWGPGTLARQARGSVDAAFASYVFHLLPNPGGLKLLSMRLKIGGVLVANFHKGEGVEFVTRHLTESGCSSRTVMPTVAENRHGVYVAYVKR